MFTKSIILILASVTMSAVAQLALKTGMSSDPVQNALQSGTKSDVLLNLLTSPGVIGGLLLYSLGAILWLFVLAKVDLSMAYPFVGLGFILTMAFGALVLGELVTLPRILGTILIAIGCVFVARSA